MEQRFEVDVPLDLRRTLRLMEMWGATTWLKTDDSGCWFAQREASGAATVRIVQHPDHLHAEAWGPGAEELLARVPQLAGLDNVGAEDVVPAHPRLREILKRSRGVRVGRSGRVYSRLVSTGLAQIMRMPAVYQGCLITPRMPVVSSCPVSVSPFPDSCCLTCRMPRNCSRS